MSNTVVPVNDGPSVEHSTPIKPSLPPGVRTTPQVGNPARGGSVPKLLPPLLDPNELASQFEKKMEEGKMNELVNAADTPNKKEFLEQKRALGARKQMFFEQLTVKSLEDDLRNVMKKLDWKACMDCQRSFSDLSSSPQLTPAVRMRLLHATFRVSYNVAVALCAEEERVQCWERCIKFCESTEQFLRNVVPIAEVAHLALPEALLRSVQAIALCKLGDIEAGFRVQAENVGRTLHIFPAQLKECMVLQLQLAWIAMLSGRDTLVTELCREFCTTLEGGVMSLAAKSSEDELQKWVDVLRFYIAHKLHQQLKIDRPVQLRINMAIARWWDILQVLLAAVPEPFRTQIFDRMRFLSDFVLNNALGEELKASGSQVHASSGAAVRVQGPQDGQNA